MAREQDYIDAVENGADTTHAVAEALGKSEGHTQKVMKQLVDEGRLVRDRDGNGYVYSVGDGTVDDSEDAAPREAAQSTQAVGESAAMPAPRPYLPEDDPDFIANPDRGFEDMKVGRPNEFFSPDGELREILALARARHSVGGVGPFLIRGHTGTAKTTAVMNVAAALDATFVTVQCSHDMTDSDLIGKATFAGGQTAWVDEDVTKALMASNYGPTVVLLDELNRAPAQAKNALFAALDDRCEVRLDGGRGGEVVTGDRENLLVFATINEGPEYAGTHRMDHAEQSRFVASYTFDYLASDSNDHDGIEREAELLTARTGVHPALSRVMVECVAAIRERAADDTDTVVQVGIPTRSLLAWGETATVFADSGFDDPVVRAARRTVMSYYDGPQRTQAYDEVFSIIADRCGGASLDPDEFAAWSADEVVECGSCDYCVPKPTAEDDGVLALGECPDCGDDIRTRVR